MPGHAPAYRSAWQWRLWLSGLIGSRYDGLAHFHVVEPGVLLRSGQPHVRDLASIAREHGLRTIVCARGGTRHPLRGAWFRKERRFCAERGIDLVHMPFSDAATPPAEIFDRFLAILRQPTRRPVLVHCEQGFHRTGILCAAFRIAEQRWPIDRAIAEMNQLGFETHRAKRRELLDALLDWSRRQVPRCAP